MVARDDDEKTLGALGGEYETEPTTAKILKISTRTLRKWRAEGKGPPYVEVARRFYYSRVSCVAWLRSLEVRPQRSKSRAA